MRRFEVWRLAEDTEHSLVMILQSERLSHLRTVIVAPVQKTSQHAVVPKLTPRILLSGEPYTVLVPFLATVFKADLVERVGECPTSEWDIMAALDRVLTGI
jgi:mRNA-degrading endonuclease toxin of MazEF toxin-antitoxin module